MSTQAEEAARETPRNKAPLTAAAVVRCLRWAVVLGLVCFAWSEVIYLVLGPEVHAVRPAPLAVVANHVFMILFHFSPPFLFVAAGAKIAPRARLATAIVLAAALVTLSLWSHVLFMVPDRNLLIAISDLLDHPWALNYRYFTFEALGAVLGVVYIFWSEKAKGPWQAYKSAGHDRQSQTIPVR
jgi:hypothetical protein